MSKRTASWKKSLRSDLHGLLIVDKPGGITSHDVVEEIRTITRVRKVGHMGTLDPFATGVLPLGINEGTKCTQFFLKEPKSYVATMKLGEETDTQDCTGRITARYPVEETHLSFLSRVCEEFMGRIEQIPPMFSAVKVKGVPLYKFAHRGQSMEREPRWVEIFHLRIIAVESPMVTLEVTCSGGTYIRTLCTDIGQWLGCGAHVVRLRRTACGNFTEKGAIPLARLKDTSEDGTLKKLLVPVEEALGHYPSVQVNSDIAQRLKNGGPCKIQNLELNSNFILQEGMFVRVSSDRSGFIAVGRIEIPNDSEEGNSQETEFVKEFGVIQPVRIFHLQGSSSGAGSLQSREGVIGY